MQGYQIQRLRNFCCLKTACFETEAARFEKYTFNADS